MLARWTVIGAATWSVASLALAPPALAQPLFFDDFDGSDLLPHWRTPDPSHWEYHVSDSQLHVTELLFPSLPKLGGNDARIGASFEPQTDFRLDVWMGWEQPARPIDQLFVTVSGSTGGIMADFGLRNLSGSAPVVAATSGAGDVSAPPPPPGIYQFTIARTGSQFDFYLNEEHFGSLPDQFGLAAGGVTLSFHKPFPGEMNPYHVDRIKVVPSPGAFIVGTICVLACARRRR